MTKTLSIGFATFLLALLTPLTGCEKKAPTTGGATSGGATTAAPADAASDRDSAAEIVIGHYGSLTGSEATFGRSTDEGIKLAVAEINAAGDEVRVLGSYPVAIL